MQGDRGVTGPVSVLVKPVSMMKLLGLGLVLIGAAVVQNSNS